jgi:predicted TIM-barrel fold metal-dependent hydrolase
MNRRTFNLGLLGAGHFGKPAAKLGVQDPGFRYLLGLGRTGQVRVKLSAPYRSSNERRIGLGETPAKRFRF